VIGSIVTFVIGMTAFVCFVVLVTKE